MFWIILEGLANVCPLRYEPRGGHSSIKDDLGSFDIPPLELLCCVLGGPDIKTLIGFMSISKPSKDIACQLSVWKSLTTQALVVLRARVNSGAAPWITCNDSYASLCWWECSSRAGFSVTIDLFRCQRVCPRCAKSYNCGRSVYSHCHPLRPGLFQPFHQPVVIQDVRDWYLSASDLLNEVNFLNIPGHLSCTKAAA
ncbi:hypothetical protein EV356DRAFT_353210 [Viridothelium virens]|uniref:F-box domain-containing protein n=1 Tax=Viridothelium virens TaxID=1048519 RepID=A0A6A6GWT1_VIRVR|nr:hypothetical protein EV356DRAFT_353210 [Viridothelium virens]